MIKPGCLKAGDFIGVVAPSDAVEKESLKESTKILKEWGFRVKFGQHLYSKVGDFMAGTAEERMADLREMINDSQVKAVWCATGGYAATEILPLFGPEVIDQLKKTPKWFVGYSDVCMILNALFSFKIASLMGPNLWGLPDWNKRSQALLRQMLVGEKVDGIDESWHWKSVTTGEGEGRIVACDLETLIFSFGTKFDPLMYGEGGNIILGIEELDIEMSTLQRQVDIIFNHKKAHRIKGFVCGRLVNIKEASYPEWGKAYTPQKLVAERLRKIGIPMAFCDDFGHPEWDYGELVEIKKYFHNRNFVTIPNGMKVKLVVEEKTARLDYLESVCG